jgi:hypothetical protein
MEDPVPGHGQSRLGEYAGLARRGAPQFGGKILLEEAAHRFPEDLSGF